MTGTEENIAPRNGAARSFFGAFASKLMTDVLIAAVIAAISFMALSLPVLFRINAQDLKETGHETFFDQHDDLRRD